MGDSKCFILLAALVLVQPLMGATKDGERPDREMLRMMDFLHEMEMIKQMEMMEDMKNLESPGEPTRQETTQKSPPTGKKEATK